MVKRWSLEGDPRGVAVGTDGTLYVGLAARQSIIAVDPENGSVLREVVLDSAEIAATKELVTLRTNPSRNRLYVANGSDESAMILSLPDLAVIREITMEGETIRDALPDPKGRHLYLLGRRVHVFDGNGQREIRTLNFDDPMAIAVSSNGSTLAVVGTEDFGNTKATVVALYETTAFKEIAREPLQTDKIIEAALFAASDRALVALSREHLFEKPVTSRRASVARIEGDGAQLRMRIEFGDIVSSERICLPENSGPQIATIGSASDLLLYAERRCSASGALAGSDRHVVPASLYGVNAYALAYDRDRNTLVATDREGFLTIYRVPRPALVR
ncbi:MAG TPA: hypothetical protein VNA04_03015 [Thermoanaerobaculia bacterium]|nr:hypothetical protein [Thermoanaerobaculia bacterium]